LNEKDKNKLVNSPMPPQKLVFVFKTITFLFPQHVALPRTQFPRHCHSHKGQCHENCVQSRTTGAWHRHKTTSQPILFTYK